MKDSCNTATNNQASKELISVAGCLSVHTPTPEDKESTFLLTGLRGESWIWTLKSWRLSTPQSYIALSNTKY